MTDDAKVTDADRRAAISWTCGCGWVNGINLAICARCGRTPNEGCGVVNEPITMQPERDAAAKLAERMQFIASQKDKAGNWAVEIAKDAIAEYEEAQK